jgi:hypothetical protein
VCIGLNKKVMLFLHGSYLIMAYYNPNPIILDNIPIKPLYIQLDKKVLLVRVSALELDNSWREIEVLSNCEGFKLREVSLQNFSIFSLLLSYLHHISSRHYVLLLQYVNICNTVASMSIAPTN